MKRPILFLFFLLTMCCTASYGQLSTYQSKNKLNLKNSEIKKLTFIQLKGGDKQFPDSYLLGMRDDNLILATDIANKWTDKSIYVKSEINIRNYDQITMLNRAEKHRKMAIWGAIFGAVGYYFARDKAQPTPWEVRNKLILGQQPNQGNYEGIMGAITGIGFGMIIGRELAKRRVNLNRQKRKAVRKLKEFSFYD